MCEVTASSDFPSIVSLFEFSELSFLSFGLLLWHFHLDNLACKIVSNVYVDSLDAFLLFLE